MKTLTPTNIQAIGTDLAIAWSNGTEPYIPFDSLRRACPCAVCGGEPDVLGRVVRPQVSYTPQSFDLNGFSVVGGYALQPAWADGHSSGLYTFPYLQRLAEEAASDSVP